MQKRILRTILVLAGALALMAWWIIGPATADIPRSDETGGRQAGIGILVNDPLLANSGAYTFSRWMLTLGGPLSLDYSFYYRSDNNSFGYRASEGFEHSFFFQLRQPISNLSTRLEATGIHPGEVLRFLKSGGVWNLDAVFGVRYVLKEDTSYFYLLDPIGARIYTFRKNGSGPHVPAAYEDRNGNHWTFTLSSANPPIPQQVSDGLGRTLSFTYGASGFLTGVTDFGGRTITLAEGLAAGQNVYTSITDTLGRTINFGYVSASVSGLVPVTYDAQGLLSAVTLPTVGAAAYTRDAAGRLTRITDQDGRPWNFGYSGMGRMASQTDPLGRVLQYRYDARGRLNQVTFPEGGTAAYSYDAAGNLTRTLYSDGTDLQFTYDALDRIISASGINISYDFEGRVTNTDNPGTGFGATYDDAGRLKTATYNNGAFTVTYTYDAATGLLTQVRDNLANAQVGFAYDNDFRLTGMTRSNGVNATFTWDNAARLTRIQEGSFLDLKYTLDAAGQVVQADMTAPLDAAPAIGNSTINLTFNAASEINAAGYAYDQRGRLTASPGRTYVWDGASRLRQIGGVTLTYNGLGDLVTRAEGGTTLRFYYNLAVGGRAVVAEKNDMTGQFLRYYIWTPGGSLLYMIDAANGNRVYFYHLDRIGSTLVLTDNSGAVTDAYAYTPYGKRLARSGTNPQPFTFIGGYGVRQEGTDGTLYQMRARYYDAVTGRFLTRDPVWPRTDNPLELDPYAYAMGDPVLHSDPEGTGALLNSLWKFDLDQMKWEELIPVNAPLERHGEKRARMNEDLWRFFVAALEQPQYAQTPSLIEALMAQLPGSPPVSIPVKLTSTGTVWMAQEVGHRTNRCADTVVPGASRGYAAPSVEYRLLFGSRSMVSKLLKYLQVEMPSSQEPLPPARNIPTSAGKGKGKDNLWWIFGGESDY